MSIDDKNEKSQFFEEIFLLIDSNINIVFGIFSSMWAILKILKSILSIKNSDKDCTLLLRLYLPTDIWNWLKRKSLQL